MKPSTGSAFSSKLKRPGRLSHPGIVTIFDVGEEPASHEPYIVMEYVAGQSLSHLLTGKNKKLPLGPGLQIAQELAEALDYAHSQGVVHRDIKPANIMITVEGHAKIADFGIAKLNQAHMTLPGQVLGSPAYMAPEQLGGEGVDGRADLFSLGVILYNMITGFKPFQGNSATTVCFKVVNREPLPASSLDSELPAQLDNIVVRAMAKDPEQRYQTGAEMARDIQALRGSDKTLQETTTFFKTAVQERIGFTDLRATSVKRSAQTIRQTTAPMPSKISLLPKKFVYAASAILLAITGLITYETAHLRGAKPVAGPGLAAAQAHATDISENAAKSIEDLVNRAATPDPADRVAASPSSTGDPKSTSKRVPKSEPVPASHKSASSLKPAVAKVDTPVVGSAKLQIHIEHPFTAAELSIWMDNTLIYSQGLQAQTKKHALFHHAEGYDLEGIDLAAGEHKLHVRVQSTVDTYDQSRTVTGKFVAGGESALRILCDKHDLQVLITP